VGLGGGRLLCRRRPDRAGGRPDGVRAGRQHLLRPLVNAINRIPLDAQASEATYQFKLAVTPEALPAMRDHLVEQLEKAKYPVADVDVVEHGDDLLEIVATLVSTAIHPAELEAVVADLQRQPGVRHATWEVSTKD
jgi:putative Mg2+ transporter-C (MgtC) family protein